MWERIPVETVDGYLELNRSTYEKSIPIEVQLPSKRRIPSL